MTICKYCCQYKLLQNFQTAIAKCTGPWHRTNCPLALIYDRHSMFTASYVSYSMIMEKQSTDRKRPLNAPLRSIP